jgi:deoxyribonuclease V
MNYNDITITEAVKIQNELKSKLVLDSSPLHIKTIAGADISFNKYSTTVYAGIVILSFPELIIRSYSLVTAEVTFPYVPGFLAFREVPALMKAWDLIPQKPEVLIVDGHGIAHPRRMGIAAHFGTLAEHATIGCAKKLLFGKYNEPGIYKNDISVIYDKEEKIGYALRTKDKVKPVFISPGNKMSLENSISVIKDCIRKHRLPEPTRLAHETVNRFRTGELKEGYTSIDQPYVLF